ncbi:MAG: hypothetical protein ACI80V_000115 [Rhodothermales bacterium]|jgi:hypothetical protein
MIDFPKLSQLPADANVWLYAASRQLTQVECGLVEARLSRFVDGWSSHGRSVLGMSEIAEGRILAMGAVVPNGDISGCGIDKSAHVLDEIGREMGVEWLAGLSIAFRDRDGAIQVTDRPTFRKLVKANQVGQDTTVIDLSVVRVAEMESGLEKRLGDSWHGTVFGLTADKSLA